LRGGKGGRDKPKLLRTQVGRLLRFLEGEKGEREERGNEALLFPLNRRWGLLLCDPTQGDALYSPSRGKKKKAGLDL